MRIVVIRRAASLSIRGRATLVIRLDGERVVERALRDIDALLVIGSHVKISSALPPVFSAHNIPMAIIAKDSVAILVNPIGTRYNNYRRLQYQLEKGRALDIALEYIKARISGMKNILKYYRIEIPQIPAPPENTGDVEAYENNIRSWESVASHILWGELVKILKPGILESLRNTYNFSGRKPRHPDPFNKALSVMYAVLYSLATKALIAAGLDPTYGFLHRTRYSTPLTFDYTEMYKPIAIQAVLELLNRRGLPLLDRDGELTKESLNDSIEMLYSFLTKRHLHTKKTPYQYIFLKAFCLAKYLEGRCPLQRITITWDRRNYK